MSEQYIKLSDVVDTIYRDWWCDSNLDARLPSVIEDINKLKTYTMPEFKVGDEVYMITKTHERVTMQGKFKGVKVEIIPDFVNIVVDPKRVFKTKEAAEQALKELRKIEFKEGD